MDRRDFLWSVAAASSMTGFQPGQTPRSSPNQRGLKLGTVTYNIAKDWDLPTLIKNLTDTGFEAVELRTTHKHGVEISLPGVGAGGGAETVRGLAREDWRSRNDMRVSVG